MEKYASQKSNMNDRINHAIIQKCLKKAVFKIYSNSVDIYNGVFRKQLFDIREEQSDDRKNSDNDNGTLIS